MPTLTCIGGSHSHIWLCFLFTVDLDFCAFVGYNALWFIYRAVFWCGKENNASEKQFSEKIQYNGNGCGQLLVLSCTFTSVPIQARRARIGLDNKKKEMPTGTALFWISALLNGVVYCLRTVQRALLGILCRIAKASLLARQCGLWQLFHIFFVWIRATGSPMHAPKAVLEVSLLIVAHSSS